MPDVVSLGGLAADIILNTGNLDQDLAKVRSGLSLIDMQFAKLKDDLAQGRITTQQYLDGFANWRKIHDDAAKQARELGAAVRESDASGGLDEALSMRAVRGVRRLATSLQTGKDAVRSFVTAIPMIIGNSMGPIGAGIAAIGVAFYELYENWNKIREAMGDDTPFLNQIHSLKGMEEAVKALNAEIENGTWFRDTPNVVEMLRELEDRIKSTTQAMSAADAMEKKRSKDEKAGDDRFKDVMAEGPNVVELDRKIGDSNLKKAGNDFHKFLKPYDQDKLDDIKEESNRLHAEAGYKLYTKSKEFDSTRDRLKVLDAQLDELKKKARVESERLAKEERGEASYNKETRKKFGADVFNLGGKENEELSKKILGGGFTEKEREEAAKAAKKIDDDKAKEKLRRHKAALALDKSDAARGAKELADEENAAKKKHKDDITRAKGDIPGLDDIIRNDIMTTMLHGGKPDDVKKIIADRLRETKDFSEEEIKDIVGELHDKNFQEVGERIVREELKGEGDGKDKKESKSEVYDTAQLNAKIQSSISDQDKDDKKGARDDQKAMRKDIAELVRQGKLVLNVKVT